MSFRLSAAAACAALGASTFVTVAEATERRFTYTHGSDVVNRGQSEIEPWTTFRVGRGGYYNRFDHRIEFEMGVSSNLQSAWYLNFSSVTRDSEGIRTSDFEWQGVSWELKYKLSDPVADGIGLALYAEPGLGPTEAEAEVKLIADKRSGDWYGAGNLAFEHEWEFEPDATERELGVEIDLGLARFLRPSLSAGIEVRNHNEIPGGKGWEHSALFAGPVLSYGTEGWWATVSVLPQLPALKGKTRDGLVLDEHERLNARVLLGFHL